MPDTSIYAPDGTVRSIPDDQVNDALAAGGKLAVKMKDPSGMLRYIPQDKVAEAKGAGGVVADQPKETVKNAPLYERAWNFINTPLVDIVSGGANITAKGLMQQATGDPFLYDSIRSSQSRGPSETDAKHPILYGLKQGLSGAAADTADTVASFTSPASIALMGAGAAAKAPGAIGTASRAILRSSAPVIAGAGAKQIYDAGLDLSPEAMQKRLMGGAMLAGGGAGVVEAAAPRFGAVGHELANGPVTQAPARAVEAVRAAPEVAKQAVKDVGNTASDVADALKAGTKSTGQKYAPVLFDGPPEQLMTRAVKPGKNNVGWEKDIKTAMPEMKAAEVESGKPVENIADALKVATEAKKKIWQEYQDVLGPNANARFDGNPIADAMIDSVHARHAAQNPGLVKRITAIADTYRRQMSLGEAEDFLESVNTELHSYYVKNKISREVAKGDPEVAYKLAEADMLRSSLYSKLDELSGPGASDLKRRYGALINVESQLQGRKLVSDRQQPESLSEQIAGWTGAGKIAKGVFTLSPGSVLEGAENIATSRYLKQRNSTDGMIQRAFEAHGKPGANDALMEKSGLRAERDPVTGKLVRVVRIKNP